MKQKVKNNQLVIVKWYDLWFYLNEWHEPLFKADCWLVENIEGFKRLLKRDPTYKNFGIWKKKQPKNR